MSKLAFILGGAPSGSSRALPDFAADERKSRRRALARALRRVMRDEEVGDDDLVAAVEDAFSGFKEDE